MLFSVIQTHRVGGAKIPREELLNVAPKVGELVIQDWREGNAENRALRVAYLKEDLENKKPQLLLPLFEPVVVRMTTKGFLLKGYQIDSKGSGEELVQYVQGWWVRHIENPL